MKNLKILFLDKTKQMLIEIKPGKNNNKNLQAIAVKI